MKTYKKVPKIQECPFEKFEKENKVMPFDYFFVQKLNEIYDFD